MPLVLLFYVPVVIILLYYFLLIVQIIRAFGHEVMSGFSEHNILMLTSLFYIVTIILTLLVGPMIMDELFTKWIHSYDIEFSFVPYSIGFQATSLLTSLLLLYKKESHNYENA